MILRPATQGICLMHSDLVVGCMATGSDTIITVRPETLIGITCWS